jgi:hypothetical protein
MKIQLRVLEPPKRNAGRTNILNDKWTEARKFLRKNADKWCLISTDAKSTASGAETKKSLMRDGGKYEVTQRKNSDGTWCVYAKFATPPKDSPEALAKLQKELL